MITLTLFLHNGIIFLRRRYPNMNDILKPYLKLVPFLHKMLGPDYEIALHEIGEEGRIIAIENGHITGRHVGMTGLTNKALQIIQEGTYKKSDYIANYLGISINGRPLRSSTFFIKDNADELVGLLCINFDDSSYRNLLDQILHLCHPSAYIEENAKINFAPTLILNSGESDLPEHFSGSATDAVIEIIKQTLAITPVPVDRMTQDEKLDVVEKLAKRGVFLIKGSVSLVSDSLCSSEATIYRYLSKLNKS